LKEYEFAGRTMNAILPAGATPERPGRFVFPFVDGRAWFDPEGLRNLPPIMAAQSVKII
jgi:hypothetical protein